MFTNEELDDLRELQETFFNAHIQIIAQRGDGEFDPTTLERTDDEDVILYDGPGSVMPTTRNYERAFDFGEMRQNTRTYNVRVRWNMYQVRNNDVIKVTQSRDPMANDQELVVIDPQIDTNATVRIMVAELHLDQIPARESV